MGIFNFSKSVKPDILGTICPIAEEGVNYLEQNYKSVNNTGKFEIYMFNILLGWMYYLERDQINIQSDIGNQKLLKLYEYSLKSGIKWKITQMVELYKERFKSFKKDIQGLQKSNYPETKQYLPAYTFSVIYYEQLEKYPDMDWTDYNDENKFDTEKNKELSEFTGTLIDQINWIYRKLGVK